MMYTNIESAYNDNTAELDKMARALNDKKDNLFKAVEMDYENKQKQWEHDIQSYNNRHRNYLLPDYQELPESDKYSDIYSELDSISIDSPSLDSYIDSVKKPKNKTNKSVHKFIQSLDQEECSKDEDIFMHIKYCFECKNKLLKYLHKEKEEKIQQDNVQPIKSQSLFSYFGTLQAKEIIIIVALGIILIIFLDFLTRSPYSVR